MHRFRSGDLAGRDNRWNVQIAIARGRWPDAHAFIGKPDMHRLLIGGRMHRHRLDPQFAAGPQHPERDFSAIGNEDLVEHHYSITTSASPYSTGWPFSTRICVTLPAFGAGIWFIVFMA